jgi:hypothetical protein
LYGLFFYNTKCFLEHFLIMLLIVTIISYVYTDTHTRTCMLTRETREGWPLLTVKTGVNGVGTQRVQMTRVLPWSVRWVCRAGTRDFYPSTKYFSPPLSIFMYVSPSPSNLGSAVVQGSLSLIECLRWGLPPPPPPFPRYCRQEVLQVKTTTQRLSFLVYFLCHSSTFCHHFSHLMPVLVHVTLSCV